MASNIRQKESGIHRLFLTYHLLIVHAFLASIMAVFMLRYIDGIVVNYNGQKFQFNAWRADDITTIVSAAVVIIRIASTAWTTKSAWMCAFILLETDGVTLMRFNRIISWPICWLGWSRHASIASVVLLLLVPPNLVAPVLTGAVGWQEVSLRVESRPFVHSQAGVVGANWYWYSTRSGPQVETKVQMAVGYAAAGWSPSDIFGPKTCRSLVRYDHAMPVNSTIDDIILPCLEIHSISWTKKSDFTQKITEQLTYSKNESNLTLSGERPFNYYHGGNAAMFDASLLEKHPPRIGFRPERVAPLPPPSTFSGTKKIALLVVRQKRNGCNLRGSTIFGNKTSMMKIEDLYATGNDIDPKYIDEQCFLIGTVNFTAGVIRSRPATYSTMRVVQAIQQSPIEPDPWVTESLYLLPDVMPKVSLMNLTQLATWDNMEGYLNNLIRISYMATWAAVAAGFNSEPLNLTAHEHANRLQAVVSRPRVCAWYFVQLLVTTSGLMLWYLQLERDRPIVINGGAAALMVDSKPALDEHKDDDLTRMSYVTKTDCAGKKLWLVHDPGVQEDPQLSLGLYSADQPAHETSPHRQRFKLSLSRRPGTD